MLKSAASAQRKGMMRFFVVKKARFRYTDGKRV